ncbi:unnamed protein product, partial [Closterium sp. Naga37s-1]
VRVLVRRSSDVSDLPLAVERAYGDVTDGASVLAAAEDCEAAFHLAALVQAWWPDERAFERVNVGGLENMLQALRETASLRRLVYVSSFFALGPTDGAIGDSSQEHPGGGFCTEYERTKWVADKVARRAVESEGLDVVLVYPCVIYGPGRISASNLVVKMIADHFQGRLPGLLGSGTRLNNFVHVNDVVLGLLAAHHRGTPGRRYILGGENASMVQLFQAVQRATGKPPPRLRLPLWLVAVLGWVSVLVAKWAGPYPSSLTRCVLLTLLFQAAADPHGPATTPSPPPSSPSCQHARSRSIVPGPTPASILVFRFMLAPCLLLPIHLISLSSCLSSPLCYSPPFFLPPTQFAPDLSTPFSCPHHPSPQLPVSAHIQPRLGQQERAVEPSMPVNPLVPLSSPLPPPNCQSVRAFNHEWAYSSEQAQQDLEYSPLSLEEGLRDTLTWMRAVGAIK